MTDDEEYWLEGGDPGWHFQALETCTGSDRKRRLIAVACCRRILPLIQDEVSRRTVEVAERFADGLADNRELEQARLVAHQVEWARRQRIADPGDVVEWLDAAPGYLAEQVANPDAQSAAYLVGLGVLGVGSFLSSHQRLTAVGYSYPEPAATDIALCWEITLEWSIALLHEVFGDPFRPAIVNPAWRTATVVSLATAIYDERAFDRLPILADALEDAGCDNADMLNHCRQPGDHVRGCWVVDLLLAKE